MKLSHRTNHRKNRLSRNLHNLIENVTLADLPDTVASLKDFGGYFKRYRLPNVFKDIADRDSGKPLGNDHRRSALTPEQKIHLSFLKADVLCAREEETSDVSGGKRPDQVGSTGSVAIVQTKDKKPFWDSQQYDIMIGHVGDTRYELIFRTGRMFPHGLTKTSQQNIAL